MLKIGENSRSAINRHFFISDFQIVVIKFNNYFYPCYAIIVGIILVTCTYAKMVPVFLDNQMFSALNVLLLFRILIQDFLFQCSMSNPLDSTQIILLPE